MPGGRDRRNDPGNDLTRESLIARNRVAEANRAELQRRAEGGNRDASMALSNTRLDRAEQGLHPSLRGGSVTFVRPPGHPLRVGDNPATTSRMRRNVWDELLDREDVPGGPAGPAVRRRPVSSYTDPEPEWSKYHSHPDPEEERIERKQEQYREEGPDWGI